MGPDPVPPGEIAVVAGDADRGLRLDHMLALRLPALSRTRLKALILAGHVSRAGEVLRDPALKIRPGHSFVVMIPASEAPMPAAQQIPLAIPFEDAHLLVVDKPAGLVVHPAPGNPDGTLVNALLAHCGASLAGIGGVRRPGIVHRLDKDTSGLLVVAKSEAAHHALSRDFAQRRITRAYAAFVWGVPMPAAGEIAGAIGRSPANRQKMAIVAEGRGKEALTRYRVLRGFAGQAALVECRLATGRTHQIRVHLAARGHPLIGDRIYGTRAPRMGARRIAGLGTEAAAAIASFPRQALHARLLGFAHPVSGAALLFESELPEDLAALLASLETL